MIAKMNVFYFQKKKYKNPRYKNYSYNLIKRPATPWGMIGVVL